MVCCDIKLNKGKKNLNRFFCFYYMEKMSDDILRIISSFLSLKEQINVRIVSKGFELSIPERNRNVYRLDNKIQNFLRREDKLENEIYMININIYQKRSHGVHSLFIKQRNDCCIVQGCYAHRLGYIYIKDIRIPPYWDFDLNSNMWACSKRKIPYCKLCFERWVNLNNIVV